MTHKSEDYKISVVKYYLKHVLNVKKDVKKDVKKNVNTDTNANLDLDNFEYKLTIITLNFDYLELSHDESIIFYQNEYKIFTNNNSNSDDENINNNDGYENVI